MQQIPNGVLKNLEQMTGQQFNSLKLNESAWLELTEGYFKSKQFKTERIQETGMKNPDFKVFWNREFFYCEIKNPLLLFDFETSLYKHRTKLSKMRGLIRKASKQFDSINPNHRVSNVMVWFSNHMQLNYSDLVSCLSGKVHGIDFTQDRIIKETNKYLKNIDIHIWFQTDKEGASIYQQSYFLNRRSGLNCENLFDTIANERHFYL